MSSNPAPLGNTDGQLLFTEEALAKKFSFSFTRKELVIIMNALNPIQLPLGDLRTKVLTGILQTIDSTAFSSITNSDLAQPAAQQPLPPTNPNNPIQTN